MGNLGADLVQIYEIGTRFMIESGWAVPMQNMIDADNFDTSKLEEICLHTTLLMTNFILCLLTLYSSYVL